MAYVQKNNPIKKRHEDNGKKQEIKDNIFFIPDLSDKAYDLDIVKQHIFNRPKRRFKKPKKNYQQNIDRLV